MAKPAICTHFQLILVKSLKGHLQLLERTLQNVGLESCEVLMFVCPQRRLMLQFAIMHSAFSQPSLLLLAVVSYYYPFCDKSLRVASSCRSNFPESFFFLTCSLALLEMELITTMLPHYCFLLHLSADLDVEKIKELRTIQLKVKLSDEVRLSSCFCVS